MHVSSLAVSDFRSYEAAEVTLAPGVTTLIGRNGQGKTNLVEALGYVATLASHRVATDQPLVRFGATAASVRAVVVRHGRETSLDIEINPGRANRAKINRGSPVAPRETLGTLRTVLFAPEDLSLVKGDPAGRRRFVDDLLVARQPRWAGVRADYERVLKQRNALLKSAAGLLRTTGRRGAARRSVSDPAYGAQADAVASALHTLEVWDDQLAGYGAQLLYARLRLLRDLSPDVAGAYDEVSDAASNACVQYRSSLHESLAAEVAAGEVPEVEALRLGMLMTLAEVRDAEVDRGVSLVGPHRDDLVLHLGDLPAKGYASHGESWSFALALKLAAFDLLRRDIGDDPVLVLDDVFAELDTGRRERLAARIATCEQVLITAAVAADVPRELATGQTLSVTMGSVTAGSVDG